MAGDGHADLLRPDRAARGFHADDGAARIAHEAGQFAILNDVDAAIGRAARITPDHCVVPRGAAAALQQPAHDRKPRMIIIEKGRQLAHRRAVEQLGIDAMQPHRIAAPGEGVALRVGVIEVEDAALADHRVIVEVLLEALPQLHRPFVERSVAVEPVIRADDGGVSPGIAAADPSLFDHRDIGDAVHLGEVIGRCQPVAAAAHDHHVVGLARVGIAPGPLPLAMTGKRVAREAEDRKAGHELVKEY